MVNIAIGQQRAGRIEEAAATFAAALPKMIAVSGDEHPDVAIALYRFAQVQAALNEAKQAEACFVRRSPIALSKLPPGHANTARMRSGLGGLLIKREAFGEAESLLLDAFAVQKTLTGQQKADALATASALVDLYTAWGKFEKAAEYRLTTPPA